MRRQRKKGSRGGTGRMPGGTSRWSGLGGGQRELDRQDLEMETIGSHNMIMHARLIIGSFIAG